MKENLAYMNARTPDGQLHPRDHLLHRPLVVVDRADIENCVNSGGAGCFAKPQEYCREYIDRLLKPALTTSGRDPRNTAQ